MRQVEGMETSSMPRSRGRVVLAVVFALLTLSAWWEVVNNVMGTNDSPPILSGWQTIVGAMGAGAAWGAWTGARSTPIFAALYGVIAGAMVASLGPILDLPPESRKGLWTGATLVLLFGLWSAWWLRRAIERDRARQTSHIVGFD